jgi:hypothetical protein
VVTLPAVASEAVTLADKTRGRVARQRRASRVPSRRTPGNGRAWLVNRTRSGGTGRWRGGRGAGVADGGGGTAAGIPAGA